MERRQPIVVVLDLDGTVVGNIGNIVCEWELVKSFGDAHASKMFVHAMVRSLDEDGVIRPGFEALVRAIHQTPHVHAFVYTASEGRWARLLCACISKRYGIKFEGVFTRAHCIKNRDTYVLSKSIHRIYPAIRRVIKVRHGVVLSRDPGTHVVMIDNNVTLPATEQGMLVNCSTYTVSPLYDVTRFIAPGTVRAKYLEMANIMAAYALFPTQRSNNPYSYRQFLHAYMAFLASRVASTNVESKLGTVDNTFQNAAMYLQNVDGAHELCRILRHVTPRLQTR